MIVSSKHFCLPWEEITPQRIAEVCQNETERRALTLMNQWKEGAETFSFTTSGSTGPAKTHVISKADIQYSTQATFAHIDPTSKMKTSLLCINPAFIGGAMVVFRSIIQNLDLYLAEPSGSVLNDLPSSGSVDLVSMVPLQLKALHFPDLGKHFRTILLGGAPTDPLPPNTQLSCAIYATYGMTETVSHIALRSLDESHFTTTGDTQVKADKSGCLSFKGTITADRWIKTTDMGRVQSPTRFEWIGRQDFIINSGGIKINPEQVEQKLAHQITDPFILSSMPDDRLGSKPVLVVEGGGAFPANIVYAALSKYEKPQDIIFLPRLPRTKSGKINRRAIQDLFK